jgi:prepilin-type N-terminal cleavage/methylation domain-containing protein
MDHRKFTLVELMLVIAIIGILASLLFPALSKARRTARDLACLNNVNQQADIYHIFAMDNDRKFPLEYAESRRNSNVIRKGGYGSDWGRYRNQGLIHNSGYEVPIETLACPTFDDSGLLSDDSSAQKDKVKMVVTGTDRDDLDALPDHEQTKIHYSVRPVDLSDGIKRFTPVRLFNGNALISCGLYPLRRGFMFHDLRGTNAVYGDGSARFVKNTNGWLTALTENSDDAHKDKRYYNRINVDGKYYPNNVKKDNTKINTQTNLELDGGVWFFIDSAY